MRQGIETSRRRKLLVLHGTHFLTRGARYSGLTLVCSWKSSATPVAMHDQPSGTSCSPTKSRSRSRRSSRSGCKWRAPDVPITGRYARTEMTSDKYRSQKLLKAQCFHPQILNATLNYISSPERLSRICCPGRQLSWPNRTKPQRPPQARYFYRESPKSACR